MQTRRFRASQSKRFVERRQTRVIFISGLAAVCLASWTFALFRFSRLEVLTISHVDVQGADKDIVGALNDAAFAALGGSYWGFFPRANTLLYPHDAVSAAVTGASPRIATASVWRDGLAAIHVVVTEKAPAALICPTLPDLSSANHPGDDGCYFADENGVLYQSAPAFSGDVYDRYYAPDIEPDQSGSYLGSVATSSSGFAHLRELYRGVKDAGLRPVALLLKSGNEYELYVDQMFGTPASTSPGSSISTTSKVGMAGDSSPIVIYMNDSQSLQNQLSNLKVFWTKTLTEARSTGIQPVFDYIDTRYGSNVFYRRTK